MMRRSYRQLRHGEVGNEGNVGRNTSFGVTVESCVGDSDINCFVSFEMCVYGRVAKRTWQKLYDTHYGVMRILF